MRWSLLIIDIVFPFVVVYAYVEVQNPAILLLIPVYFAWAVVSAEYKF